MEARTSEISRLSFAAGCCWATLVIVSEHPSRQVAAASSAPTARGLVTVADRGFGYFSLRSGTLFLIAGLHAALFYGLIATLAHTHGGTTPNNLQNQILNPVPPQTLPPPLPPGIPLQDWRIDVKRLIVVVPPQVNVESEVTTRDAEKAVEPYWPPIAPESPTPAIKRVAEDGVSTVRVCVNEKGRLTSEPTTANTSGSARLDEAALKLARAGTGHYRASTEDGKPVNSCYSLAVRFQPKK